MTKRSLLAAAWLRAEWINVLRCRPPHEVTHWSELRRLGAGLAGGWSCAYPPLVGYGPHNSRDSRNHVRLLTGTHRFHAAVALGFREVPVVRLTRLERQALLSCTDFGEIAINSVNTSEALIAAKFNVVGELVRREGRLWR